MNKRDRVVRGRGGRVFGAAGLVGDLRQIWRLLALSPWRVALAVGWGVLAVGSGLGLAALAAWLIARAWQMPPVLDLSVAVVSVRALGISRGLCRYLERLATHDVALRAMTSARTTTYRALARSNFGMARLPRKRLADNRITTAPQERPGRSANTVPATAGVGSSAGSEAADRIDSTGQGGLRRGDVLARMGSDIDDLGAVVVRAFVPIAVAIVVSAAAIGLVGVISVAAAMILAVALAIAGIVAPWLSARAASAAEAAVRADRAEFIGQALTVLDHAAELRVSGRLDSALAAADTSARRAVEAQDAAARHSAWAAAVTPLSIGASVLGALLIGITVYGPAGGQPGAMTPMALAVLVLLPLSAFESVAPLPAAAQALTTARAALYRLMGAPGRSPSAAPRRAERSRGSCLTAIERGDSNHNAESERPSALDGAAQHIGLPFGLPDRPAGHRIAVVGPSGSGKTTLLMAWAGLFVTPRPGVTFFAEDAHLFGTTVLENLRVVRGDLTTAEAESVLRTVGLGPWLDALPGGVHTDLVGGAAAVSGGQRRRILLARALISPARVLLLDEPTEHLEAEAGARLLRELLDAGSGLVDADRTVVVVTHQLPPDHRADAVLQLSGSGRIATVSPPRPRPGNKTTARPPRNSVAVPLTSR